MNKKNIFNLKIGIIGCGNISNVHLRYIIDRVSMDKICISDRDPLRLDECAGRYGISNKYDNVENMLKEFKPDIVHILTPPSTHKDLAIQCLRNNCHVLIEKPACLSEKEAEEICAVSQETKRLVCIDHMRLFNRQYLKVKELIKTGKIGKVVSISGCMSHDLIKNTTGFSVRWSKELRGGILFDLAPHTLYLFLDIFPDLDVKNTMCLKNEGGDITDIVSTFTSKDGLATIHLSLQVFPLENYIEIKCTKGLIKIDFRNFLTIVRRYYGLPNAIERVFGNIVLSVQIFKQTIDSIIKFLLHRLDPYEGLDKIIDSFYSIIINHEANAPVTIEHAKAIARLADKIFPEELIPVEKGKFCVNEETGVLVTGGTGFIGRKLVNNLLEKGLKVRILSSKRNTQQILNSFSKPVEIFQGDIYNYNEIEKACTGVKTVYHLAAAMLQKDWKYHLDTTVTGTKNIIKASKKMGVKHFIYVSSLNIYNSKKFPRKGIIDENFSYEDMPEKRGNYSNAKVKAEKIVIEMMGLSGMLITILRPARVYGPGERILLPEIGYRIGKRLLVVLGNGKKKLSLVYVDNLIDALLLAGENKEFKNNIYNVVDSDYPTQIEFIKLYKHFTKEKLIVLYLPMRFVMIGFGLIELLIKLVFKKKTNLRYKLLSVNNNVEYNTTKIKDELGWESKINFKEGLKRSIG